MNIAAIVIFVAVYVVVSFPNVTGGRVDRATAVIIGVALCLAVGGVSPDQALAAIDGSTLLLLFSVMGISALLADAGVFAPLEALFERVASRPARLVRVIVWVSGVGAALVTNDAMCVLLVPVVVALIRRHGLPAAPLLLALATGANTGSVATLVGNPQNMLCGTLGGLAFGAYAWAMAPVALVSVALNAELLVWLYRRALRRPPEVTAEPLSCAKAEAWSWAQWSWHQWALCAAFIATMIAFVAGIPLAWGALAGFASMLALQPHRAAKAWEGIDWHLLVFFSGLFVLVETLVHSGVAAWVFALRPLPLDDISLATGAELAVGFVAGSNVLSNVPFILFVREALQTAAHPTFVWTMLAMSATFAGNLTLLGSAANMIVEEGGRDAGGFSFWEHARVGVPLTLLTTAIGTMWLVARMGA